MVSLHDSPTSFSFCGGTLISEKYVVTAAHCGNIPYVMIGGHDQNNPDDCREVIQVARTIIHPQYDDQSTRNDISVLELSRPSAYGPLAASLMDQQVSEGTMVTVAGWGTTSEGGSQSPVLQKVEVPVSNQAACNEVYNLDADFGSKVICAAFAEGGKDSCQGDSGGPLFLSNGNSGFSLAGVVSFGSGCARAGAPGVYTKVSAFRQWVNCQTGATTSGCGDQGTAPTPATSPTPTPPPTTPSGCSAHSDCASGNYCDSG